MKECLYWARNQPVCLSKTSDEFLSFRHQEQGYGNWGEGTGKFGWESRDLGKVPSMERAWEGLSTPLTPNLSGTYHVPRFLQT